MLRVPRVTLRRALVLALLASLLAAPGCREEEDPSVGRPASVDENDERATTLDCLTRVRGLQARLDGEDAIAIGPGDDGPRIVFFLAGGEAEARQFRGEGEGSEEIGGELLFVRNGSEEQLEGAEFCLEKV